MKTIIHVNQHVIKKNRKTGSDDPVLTVKTYKSTDYAHDVEILGPSRVVYSPDNPLSCGAHVWVETESEVKIIAKEVSREALRVRARRRAVSRSCLSDGRASPPRRKSSAATKL